MKKILFVAVLALASVMAYAQPRAIGARLGAFDGISYQHSLGESNMLEIEAGFGVYGRMTRWDAGHAAQFRGHNIQLAITYDWIDPFGATFPAVDKGEFHWYMGVGGAGGYGWYGYGLGLGYWWGGKQDWGFVGAAGRIGFEYDFWFPLQLSLDFRPTLGAGLMGYDDWDAHGNPTKTVKAGLYWDVLSICLGVRYKF